MPYFLQTPIHYFMGIHTIFLLFSFLCIYRKESMIIDDEVVVVGQPAGVGLETIQEEAQHAALWGTGAQCASGGELWAESHGLGPGG